MAMNEQNQASDSPFINDTRNPNDSFDINGNVVDNNNENDNNNDNEDFVPLMFNRKILPKIVKLLPFQTILNCRQVCPAWNEAICSDPLLSKRVVVTIRHSIESILALYLLSSDSAEANHHRASFPTWTSFRFITEALDNSSTVQNIFWERCGKSIKCLELIVHSLGPVTFLEVLLACPNLYELSFYCAPIYSSQHNLLAPGQQPLLNSMTADPRAQWQFQKLIPNLNIIQKSGILDRLECLFIKDSNFMPPGILLDLLQWGGARLKCLSLMDETTIPLPVPSTTIGAGAPNPKRITEDELFIPSWDIRHVLYLVEHQAHILIQLELTGLHILPEHVYALAKMKYLKLKILKLKSIQVDIPSLTSLLRRQKYLEELDLSYSAGVSEKAFLHPSCTFYKLRKLSLAGFTTNLDFLSFLSRMSSLVELNLSASRSYSMTWDNLIHSFLPIKLKKLSRLDLSYNIALGSLKKQILFQGFMNCFKSTLTCLNLSCTTGIRNNYLQIMWKDLTKLRILYLETMLNITDEGFTGIRQSQLQGHEFGKNDVLTVWNKSDLLRRHNNDSFHIGYCANLEVLSLSNNPKLTDVIIQFGVRFLPKLRKLKINGCGKLSDRTLFLLAGSCQKLEYLDLRCCPQVSWEWINWATNSCPSLKVMLEASRLIYHQQPQNSLFYDDKNNNHLFYEEYDACDPIFDSGLNQQQQRKEIVSCMKKKNKIYETDIANAGPGHIIGTGESLEKDQFCDEQDESWVGDDENSASTDSEYQKQDYYGDNHTKNSRRKKVTFQEHQQDSPVIRTRVMRNRTHQYHQDQNQQHFAQLNSEADEHNFDKIYHGNKYETPTTTSSPFDQIDYNGDGPYKMSIVDENNNTLRLPD